MSKAILFLVVVCTTLTGLDFSVAEPDEKVLTAKVEGRTLVVTLENKTDNDIWFWELGNMWGDGSFYLVLQNRETKKILVARYGHAIYGRHLPSTQNIPTGSKAEFRLDLDSRLWGEDTKALSDKRYEIKSVILSSGLSDISISSGVFLDRLRFDFPKEPGK